MRKVDVVGLKFGRLTVIKRVGSNGHSSIWLCRCECGKMKEVTLPHLRQGSVRSCGCLAKEAASKRGCLSKIGERAYKHGDSHHNHLYGVWGAMKRRCYNPHVAYYELYGGRGIEVCRQWHDYLSFKTWALSSGYRQGLTLDRINPDGNYEPSNCRWITIQEQQRNRRNNRYYEYHGKFYTVKEIAEMVGLKPRTIQGRIERGWIIDNVVETPCLRSNGLYFRKSDKK